ncbi:MAG: LLM class flavin-dependent oxidoreductase, partial [Hyphomicrobium sp.]|nr:LLM class flavin-dependent oxidoreductase [Hyphomicrobium sp.]
MNFGIFNLMGYRTPGTAAAALYDGAIAQVKAAEAAGFDIAWFAEHHFSNYCTCPSPLMMVARLAGEIPQLRRLTHAESCGQSAAVRSGVLAARGAIVATL